MGLPFGVGHINTKKKPSELDYFKQDLDGAIKERTLTIGSETPNELKMFYAAQLAILIDIKTSIETGRYRKLASPPRTKKELTRFQKRWLNVWGYLKPQWKKALDPEFVKSLEKNNIISKRPGDP